jgi:DDE superfamily endonuclease/helix-turn-helix, Psq domain
MADIQTESRIQLAIQAIQRDQNLTARAAAAIYSISHRTLSRRLKGMLSRRDWISPTKRLTDQEEKTIAEYILDLDSRAFPPRLRGVEDMANILLAERGAPKVGINWAANFVKRQLALKTRFSRRLDYQRAKCEDPQVIGEWFRLVRNTVAKYGIVDADIFNFDETGFMMGMLSTYMVVINAERRSRPRLAQPGNREWATVIQGVNAEGWAIPPYIIVAAKNHLTSWYEDSPLPGDWVIATTENGWTTNERGLEWIQHFDKHTRARAVGKYRLLILDGHESHHSVEFELFYKENNIITLYMPAYVSYIL